MENWYKNKQNILSEIGHIWTVTLNLWHAPSFSDFFRQLQVVYFGIASNMIVSDYFKR